MSRFSAHTCGHLKQLMSTTGMSQIRRHLGVHPSRTELAYSLGAVAPAGGVPLHSLRPLRLVQILGAEAECPNLSKKLD
jgi:hypothetical protein